MNCFFPHNHYSIVKCIFCYRGFLVQSKPQPNQQNHSQPVYLFLNGLNYKHKYKHATKLPKLNFLAVTKQDRGKEQLMTCCSVGCTFFCTLLFL